MTNKFKINIKRDVAMSGIRIIKPSYFNFDPKSKTFEFTISGFTLKEAMTRDKLNRFMRGESILV